MPKPDSVGLDDGDAGTVELSLLLVECVTELVTDEDKSAEMVRASEDRADRDTVTEVDAEVAPEADTNALAEKIVLTVDNSLKDALVVPADESDDRAVAVLMAVIESDDDAEALMAAVKDSLTEKLVICEREIRGVNETVTVRVASGVAWVLSETIDERLKLGELEEDGADVLLPETEPRDGDGKFVNEPVLLTLTSVLPLDVSVGCFETMLLSE